MDIRQLRYFAAVVEAGTISAAAKKLHISQPPLSAQMHQLEEELQVLLFERGSRQIRLTEAGRLLYHSALEMLELEQTTKEEMNNFRTGKRGALRIGLISSSASEELYRGIYSFHQKFPDVQFKVYEGNTYELMEYLRNGKIELAVIRSPFSGYGLEQVCLKTERMLAVGLDRYFQSLPWQRTDMCRNEDLRQSEELRLEELRDTPLILYRRWEPTFRKIFEAQGIEPNVVCINDDARTSLQWAHAGFGVALVPALVSGWIGDMRSMVLSNGELSSSLVLVKRSQAVLSTSAQALFRLFQEKF